MARCRLVPPDTVKLELSDGDYLIVKKRLTFGDSRRLMQAARDETKDVMKAGIVLLAVYLVDWSLVDFAGQALPIRDATETELEATLAQFEPAAVREILDAVTTHDDAARAAADAEKKTRSTAIAS